MKGTAHPARRQKKAVLTGHQLSDEHVANAVLGGLRETCRDKQ
jgi:hypothetical protein